MLIITRLLLYTALKENETTKKRDKNMNMEYFSFPTSVTLSSTEWNPDVNFQLIQRIPRKEYKKSWMWQDVCVFCTLKLTKRHKFDKL